MLIHTACYFMKKCMAVLSFSISIECDNTKVQMEFWTWLYFDVYKIVPYLTVIVMRTQWTENWTCLCHLTLCSLQAERNWDCETQGANAQEAPPCVHWYPAPHPPRHLQGNQTSIERDASHHRKAAGPWADHSSQFLYECQAALPQV